MSGYNVIQCFRCVSIKIATPNAKSKSHSFMSKNWDKMLALKFPGIKIIFGTKEIKWLRQLVCNRGFVKPWCNLVSEQNITHPEFSAK